MPVENSTALESVTLPAQRPALRSPLILVILAFLAIHLVWGSTYLAIRFAIETIPPLITVGVRQFTAGSLLLLWCLIKGQRPTWQQWRASAIIGVFFFLIGHGTLHWAEQRVPSGLCAIIIASEPMWVFLASAAAARKWRMNATLFAGLVLGLLGVGLLFQGKTLQSAPGVLLAAVAVLFGAISWSIGIVYSRRSHLSGNPVLLSAMSLVSGGAMLLIASALFGEWGHFSYAAISQRSLMALAYLIVFGSIVAFTAYNWLLERYSPTLVATHTYVNPVVAVLLGWWLAGERVTLSMGVAAAMILAAILLVERGGRTIAAD
jgi:drug/metabolite transporter (DMT)-like permease